MMSLAALAATHARPRSLAPRPSRDINQPQNEKTGEGRVPLREYARKYQNESERF